ncbi:MAG: shikimate dehydrogenase family protein [Christensenellales bacterium]|jgi:shikimate dehydrogenase
MIFDATTEIIGVIGDPIFHSLSPLIHNTIFDHYELNTVYLPFLVKKGDIKDFLTAASMMNMRGFNLTMPHKSAILPHLQTMDSTVELFAAANTVKIGEDGLSGYMFDGEGLVSYLERNHVPIENQNVVLLGAGSVTGSIALSLTARNAAHITILNRTVEKASSIASLINICTGVPTDYGELTTAQITASCETATLLIQTSSLGMKGTGSDYRQLSFLDALPKNAVVADVVYNPIETALLKHARKIGLEAYDGLGMLIGQAAMIDQAILGLKVEDDAFLKASKAVRKILEP